MENNNESCTFQRQCGLCICRDCICDCMQCQANNILPRSEQCRYEDNYKTEGK